MHPPPTSHSPTQNPLGETPASGPCPLYPFYLSSALPGAGHPLSSPQPLCPTVPSHKDIQLSPSLSMASGHHPSSEHLTQEADRGSGLHSNWGRWFHQEEVDSSTSNTGGSDAPTSPASLVPPLPMHPSSQRIRHWAQHLYCWPSELTEAEQQKATYMDSHQVLLAATYLLGTLGESLPGTARQGAWPSWGTGRGISILPRSDLGPMCSIREV